MATDNRFGTGKYSRPVRLNKADPDTGPEGVPGDENFDRMNRLQLPWKFNTGSECDDMGAQSDRPAALDDSAKLAELMCQASNTGIQYNAGDDEAIRPGEADPGG